MGFDKFSSKILKLFRQVQLHFIFNQAADICICNDDSSQLCLKLFTFGSPTNKSTIKFLP